LRRLKARGCAGIVTGGGLRDTDGIANTGLVASDRSISYGVILAENGYFSNEIPLVGEAT